MSPTLTTFLFEAANFLVLAGLLGWLFFKPVRQVLQDRTDHIEREQRQAAEKLAAAERLRQEITATRANLQEELNERRKNESEAARREADRIIADARTAAQHELERARRQAAQLSDSQQETLSHAAAIAAAEAVGTLLQQIAGPELHDALIESACQQLATLNTDRRGPAKVESARPLSEQQRAALTQALGAAAPGADFRTVDQLGAGVRIATADGLIDASIGGLTGFARRTLIKEMNHFANNHNPMRGG